MGRPGSRRSGLSPWILSWLLAGAAFLGSGRPAALQPQQYATFACGSLGRGGDRCFFIPEFLGLLPVPKAIAIAISGPADATITGANAADEAGDVCGPISGVGTATIELACPAGLGAGGTVAVDFSTAQTVSATVTFSADGASSPALNVTFAYPPPLPPAGVRGGPPVSYDAGWNLVGGPTGWNLYGGPGNSALPGPFYTYQAGDADYELIPGGSPPAAVALPAGVGVWAFFPEQTAVTLAFYAALSVAIPLPPSHWVMIANPDNIAATVSGADAVYTYDPASGYVQTTTLAPGQGAWAWSQAGGTAVVTVHPLPPPHNPPRPPTPPPGS